MVRMKDIAGDLGISVMTVSRALRNDPDINPGTRARVLQRATELNYLPNLAARALVTGRTGLMGLVIPNLAHSFFAQLAVELSAALRMNGFSLFISSSEENPELEQREIDNLLARSVDALLIASTQRSPETFRRLEERRVPYVLLDRWFPDLATNFVGVNDEAVGVMATEHLIGIGCRHIAHIRGIHTGSELGRLKGYKQALSRHGIAINPEYIQGATGSGRYPYEGGYRAAITLINLRPRPTGIFCCNDPIAIGAMTAILDAGIRIPEDIAVIGCGNLPFDSSLRVSLSSVDQRSRAIGQRAAQLAVRLVHEDVRIRPRAILLAPCLVVRQSTRRQNKSADMSAERAEITRSRWQ